MLVCKWHSRVCFRNNAYSHKEVAGGCGKKGLVVHAAVMVAVLEVHPVTCNIEATGPARLLACSGYPSLYTPVCSQLDQPLCGQYDSEGNCNMKLRNKELATLQSKVGL
jgi:hypothetical protein